MDIMRELKSKWQQRWPELAGLEFSKWTLWKHIISLNGIDRIGVYILAKYSVDEVPDNPDPIDEKVIYIGKTNIGRTTKLKNRLSYFDKEAFGTGAAHSGATTYKNQYGTHHDDLYVSICPIFWSDDEINKLTSNKENFNAWIKGTSPRPEPFCIYLIVNWLEVCLRGLHVYKWGRLPICNKE